MKQQDSQGNFPTIKDFVLQEAHEKAFEVSVMGLKDFQRQRNHILEQKKEHIHDEIQRKNKEQLATARIHRSSLINGSRMKKMQARHQNLLQIISEAQHMLCQKIITNRTQYRQLLQNMIVEGLIKMLEPVVNIKCLERDREHVESVIQEAKSQFKQLIKNQGIDSSVGEVEIKVDKYYLELRDVNRQEDREHKLAKSQKCFGGVILTNEDGLIVCKDTLDCRVELAFQQMLPVIRKQLFG